MTTASDHDNQAGSFRDTRLIRLDTEPPFAPPRNRTYPGGPIHRGQWVQDTKSGLWQVYAACHASSRSRTPQRLTRMQVTCSNCQAGCHRAEPRPSAGDRSMHHLFLRLVLWHVICQRVAPLTDDLIWIALDPDRNRVESEAYAALRQLCVHSPLDDVEAAEVIDMYIQDHTHRLLDLILETKFQNGAAAA